MTVPFRDIAAGNRDAWDDIAPALDEVINEGNFILGPSVAEFERAFADYLGTSHCVGVNSGTSALHLALLAAGVGPGDEVILPPLTWISTAWAVSYVGAKSVFADIDPVTYTLDPEAAAEAVTRRTRAILPVHLYGQSADMGRLGALADAHGLILLEDACQAHGARHRRRRVGTIGRLGCFSFFPGKNLGAFGEAGAIVTDDPDLAARARRLRNHAQARQHEHAEVGYNARMEAIQGAILAGKLRHLDRWNQARSAIAAEYGRLLANPTLTLPASPCQPENHVWHLYVVQVHGQPREEFRSALAANGIETGVHYPTPIHLQPAYGHLGHVRGTFPVAEEVAARCVSLPLYPQLSAAGVEEVACAVRRSLDGTS